MRIGSRSNEMKCNIDEIRNIVLDIMRATVEVCDKNKIIYYCQAGTVLGAIRHKGPIPWDYDADLIIPNDQIDHFAECAKRDLPTKYYVDYYKVTEGSKRQFPRIGLKGYSTIVAHLDIFRLIGLPDNREDQLIIMKSVKDTERLIAHMRQLNPVKLLLKDGFGAVLGKYGIGKYKLQDTIDQFVCQCDTYPYTEAKYVMNPSGRYKEKNIFKKEVYGEGILVPYADFMVRIPTEYDFYLKQYYGDYTKYPPEKEIKAAMEKTYIIR